MVARKIPEKPRARLQKWGFFCSSESVSGFWFLFGIEVNVIGINKSRDKWRDPSLTRREVKGFPGCCPLKVPGNSETLHDNPISHPPPLTHHTVVYVLQKEQRVRDRSDVQFLVTLCAIDRLRALFLNVLPSSQIAYLPSWYLAKRASVVMDFGRSIGRPWSLSQMRPDRTPSWRETPNKTV